MVWDVVQCSGIQVDNQCFVAAAVNLGQFGWASKAYSSNISGDRE